MSGTSAIDFAWADKTELSPELNALLICARAVIDRQKLAELPAALAVCPSVDEVCKAAIAHQMLGHLHRSVTALEAGTIAPVLVRRLTEFQRLSALRNVRQTSHLLRLLEQFRAIGVEAMPYKGPAWAERLYGDISLRSWSDLDVLVSYQQVPRVRQMLLTHGFIEGSRFNPQLLRRKKCGWGQIGFRAVDRSVYLELHWEVTVGFSARPIRAEELFARAECTKLFGRQILSPSTVDLMLLTCLNGARERWACLEKLLGLAVQVHSTNAASWPHIMAVARTAGCARRVSIAVRHTCRVFGLQTPPEVAEAIAGDTVARALVRSLTPDSLDLGFANGSRSRRELANLFWAFATEDSIADFLRHAAARFFRPGPADWEILALPPYAEWLYYVLRPAHLALKWGKRLL